jgi:hypothetical protein
VGAAAVGPARTTKEREKPAKRRPGPGPESEETREAVRIGCGSRMMPPAPRVCVRVPVVVVVFFSGGANPAVAFCATVTGSRLFREAIDASKPLSLTQAW